VVAPLERRSAEAKANIVSMVYNFNSRPIENVWLNAKYRYYDYANKTPLFESQQIVGDWSVGSAIWENEPSSMKRHTVDLDASYSPHPYLGLDLGFTRENSDRTHRIFEKTGESSYRIGVDSTGNQYVTFRGKYEHSRRTGSGFEAALLDEVGEQPLTRHYDIADRDRDRTTATVTVTPIAQLDVSASVSTGKDDYRNSGFGLRDNKNNTWSLGFDAVPIDTVSFGLNYGFEKYTALQYSRTSNPLPNPFFDDPTRDWSLDQDDKVKTFTASLDFLKTIPKTDIRFGVDLSDGKATYVYGGPAVSNSTVFTAAVPLAQLPPLKNKLTTGRFDIQHFVRSNVAVGVAYWYEDYKVDDFSLNSTTINQLNPTTATGTFASTIYSGYLYRNYTVHTGWLRLTYLW
jgi:hypothetical protein